MIEYQSLCLYGTLASLGGDRNAFRLNTTTNKNIKMSSFKSSENIQKSECGPDRSVSNNQSSSVSLNELAMKAKITGNEGQNNIL